MNIHPQRGQLRSLLVEQVKEYVEQGSFTLQDNACHDGQELDSSRSATWNDPVSLVQPHNLPTLNSISTAKGHAFWG